MSNWLKKFLEKLANANEQNFKGQRMDCCNLNKSNNPDSTKQSNK